MSLIKKSLLIVTACLVGAVAVFAQEADTVAPSISGNRELTATALFYDAVRARNKGDLKESEEMLQKVVQLDPNAAGAYYDLARINLERKQTGKASEYLEKAMKLQPGNRWYKEQYAMLLLDENKFDKAANVYEDIIRSEKNSKEYLLTLAYIYQRANENKKAIATFDKLLQVYGNDEEILEKKLQAYLNSNQLDEAVKVNNLLIEQAPDESRYYIRLAEMYYNNNQQDKAIDIYKKAEGRFPDDAGIQLSLSEYYKAKGDKENYKKYLKKAVSNKSLEAQTQLAILGGFIADPENVEDKQFATEIASTIAEQNPADARAISAFGDILAITGQYDSAAVQYKKSLEIEQSNYGVWKNLLSVFIQNNNYDSLIKYSEKALRLFPNQANLHYLNGVAQNGKKNYDKAISSLERAIDMTPEENKAEIASMYGTLADVYNSKREYKLSDETFEKSLALDPDNASTLNNYAYYLSERNARLDEAEKMSKRSLTLMPDLPTFLDTYGWILYKKGKYKEAREYIEKAIAKEEEKASGTLWEHLGDIHYKLNDTNKALECWQKAKQLGADSEHIDKKIAEKKLYE